MKKGMFLVDNRMWNVFLQTGNVEAYLVLKQLEETEREKSKEEKHELKDA